MSDQKSIEGNTSGNKKILKQEEFGQQISSNLKELALQRLESIFLRRYDLKSLHSVKNVEKKLPRSTKTEILSEMNVKEDTTITAIILSDTDIQTLEAVVHVKNDDDDGISNEGEINMKIEDNNDNQEV